MLNIYQMREVTTDPNGNETVSFINISDANYLPVAQGNTEKQEAAVFNSDVGFYYNTETSLLQFWNGSAWKTVTLL